MVLVSVGTVSANKPVLTPFQQQKGGFLLFIFLSLDFYFLLLRGQHGNPILVATLLYPWGAAVLGRNHLRHRELVSWGLENPSQDWSENPQRFDSWPCVLGCEGFTSGRHCWEVDVGAGRYSAVGVARETVSRKGNISLRGQYRALTDPRLALSVCGRLEKVGVYLDFEGGQLSFYDSASLSHLHTFQDSFAEELVPFLSTQSSEPLSMWDLEL
uniref:SPRY domain-containing protein n=1 Tax=Chelydra serpentina TaxID=8475 RepID=A0A8C3RN25_CHESE